MLISQCIFQPLSLKHACTYLNLLTVGNTVDTLCESIQILIGWQYTYWPSFKASQLCLSLQQPWDRQSSVAPSPAYNKSSHLYNTVVCTPFGRQTVLPAHCFTCCDCQILTEPDGENLYNKLMWFIEKKMCIIADICPVKLFEPNYLEDNTSVIMTHQS